MMSPSPTTLGLHLGFTALRPQQHPSPVPATGSRSPLQRAHSNSPFASPKPRKSRQGTPLQRKKAQDLEAEAVRALQNSAYSGNDDLREPVGWMPLTPISNQPFTVDKFQKGPVVAREPQLGTGGLKAKGFGAPGPRRGTRVEQLSKEGVRGEGLKSHPRKNDIEHEYSLELEMYAEPLGLSGSGSMYLQRMESLQGGVDRRKLLGTEPLSVSGAGVESLVHHYSPLSHSGQQHHNANTPSGRKDTHLWGNKEVDPQNSLVVGRPAIIPEPSLTEPISPSETPYQEIPIRTQVSPDHIPGLGLEPSAPATHHPLTPSTLSPEDSRPASRARHIEPEGYGVEVLGKASQALSPVPHRVHSPTAHPTSGKGFYRPPETPLGVNTLRSQTSLEGRLSPIRTSQGVRKKKVDDEVEDLFQSTNLSFDWISSSCQICEAWPKDRRIDCECNEWKRELYRKMCSRPTLSTPDTLADFQTSRLDVVLRSYLMSMDRQRKLLSLKAQKAVVKDEIARQVQTGLPVDECLSTKLLGRNSKQRPSAHQPLIPKNREGARSLSPSKVIYGGLERELDPRTKRFNAEVLKASEIVPLAAPPLGPPPAFELERLKRVGIGPKTLLANALKRCKEYGVAVPSNPSTPSVLRNATPQRLTPSTLSRSAPRPVGLTTPPLSSLRPQGLRASFPQPLGTPPLGTQNMFPQPFGRSAPHTPPQTLSISTPKHSGGFSPLANQSVHPHPSTPPFLHPVESSAPQPLRSSTPQRVTIEDPADFKSRFRAEKEGYGVGEGLNAQLTVSGDLELEKILHKYQDT